MFAIQVLDGDEGSCARWNNHSEFETKELALIRLRNIKKELYEDTLLSFRIAEVGSARYYSQPTDSLEY